MPSVSPRPFATRNASGVDTEDLKPQSTVDASISTPGALTLDCLLGRNSHSGFGPVWTVGRRRGKSQKLDASFKTGDD